VIKLLLFLLAVLVITGCTTVSKITRSGYEEASHKVLIKNGSIQLRSYPDLQLVETSTNQGNGGFMRLFRYIDQGNSKTEKIAMTTPVFMQKIEGNEIMSFVLPASMSRNNVPEPLDENVQVRTRSIGLYAVSRYSGKRVDGGSNKAKRELNDWILNNGYEQLSEPINAYYDTPWTPSFLRRNELLIRVKKKQKNMD